jgi:hypothetical protein
MPVGKSTVVHLLLRQEPTKGDTDGEHFLSECKDVIAHLLLLHQRTPLRKHQNRHQAVVDVPSADLSFLALRLFSLVLYLTCFSADPTALHRCLSHICTIPISRLSSFHFLSFLLAHPEGVCCIFYPSLPLLLNHLHADSLVLVQRLQYRLEADSPASALDRVILLSTKMFNALPKSRYTFQVSRKVLRDIFISF